MAVEDTGDPHPERYGQVTNPERFALLQVQARDIATQLTAHYAVERADRSEQRSTTIALSPADGGAPISFTLTDFPGVIVAYGHAGEAVYPWCGCDACADDPHELSEEMADLVAGIVAGGLVERRQHRALRADLYEQRLEHRGEVVTRRTRKIEDDLTARVPDGVTDWAPWTQRDQTV
jgi:hypothetical protein